MTTCNIRYPKCGISIAGVNVTEQVQKFCEDARSDEYIAYVVLLLSYVRKLRDTLIAGADAV